MPFFKNEPELVRFWKTKLEERYLKVFPRINLSSSKFEKYWIEYWGLSIPPSQPDIDLLIVDKQKKLHAIELKYIRKSDKRRLSQSFYRGIDESLALLRFGFESVSLWHCFDNEVPRLLRGQYHTTTSELIESLKLPIDFQGLFLDKYRGK